MTPDMIGEYIDDISPSGGGDSNVSPGAPLPLPPVGETLRMELLQSALGRPMPLAYGRHIVGGNVVFQHVNSDGTTTYFIALGEGEWDSIETLWINGVDITLPDTSMVHFHPGLDGELGTETTPGTPNQKICSFYPSSFSPRLTFARMAYLALKLPEDPESPSPALDVRGIYKTRKVRIFDSSGNQTAYQYSANPAWCILDLLISRAIKPYGTVNEALTTEEKARINFSSFVTAATYCAADPGDGDARFECHLAFIEQTDLLRALDQMLLICRGYLLDRNGEFALYIDQARASEFTATRETIMEGTLSYPRKDLRNLANKFDIKYRHLESGDGDDTKDFQPITLEVEDHDHQDQIDRIIKAEVDFGNTLPGRATRLGYYLRDRSLLLAEQIHLRILAGAESSNPIDLLPGDRITAPKDVDGFEAEDYEILEITDEQDGSREVFAQKYDADVFQEAESDPQIIFPTDPGLDTGIPGQVRNFAVTGEDGKFVATWDDPLENARSLDNVCIQYATDSGFTTGVVTAPDWGKVNRLESKDEGKTYYFRLAVHNQTLAPSDSSVKTAIEATGRTATYGWGPWCTSVGPISSGIPSNGDTAEPTVPTTPSPGTLWASADGLSIIFGCVPSANDNSTFKAELRVKLVTAGHGLVDDVDMRTAAEGGSDTNLWVFEDIPAAPGGWNYPWTAPFTARYAYCWRFKNQVGWSAWTSGDASVPQNVPVDHTVSTTEWREAFPPFGSTVTIERGPLPGTVVVRATRPTSGGHNLLRWVVQIKDSSTGSWRALDANTGAAQTHYDGSGAAHTTSDGNRRITRNSGTIGTLGTLAGKMILLDVRGDGQTFSLNRCQWGVIDANGIQVDGDGKQYIELVTGRWRIPASTRGGPENGMDDFRVKIVEPFWDWTTEGYLGNQANEGYWGEWIDDRNHQDEFVSAPIVLEDTYQSIDARVWFESHYCVSDAGQTFVSSEGVPVQEPYEHIVHQTQHGVFFEGFEHDIDHWVLHSEAGTRSIQSTGEAGGKALRCTGYVQRQYPVLIPFEPDKLYRIRARVRWIAPVDDTNNFDAFVGVVGYAADRTTRIGTDGGDNNNAHWNCIYDQDLDAFAVDDWHTFTGWFKGHGSDVTGASTDSMNPKELYTGIRYFSPCFALNFNNGAGSNISEIDSIQIDVMDEAKYSSPAPTGTFANNVYDRTLNTPDGLSTQLDIYWRYTQDEVNKATKFRIQINDGNATFVAHLPAESGATPKTYKFTIHRCQEDTQIDIDVDAIFEGPDGQAIQTGFNWSNIPMNSESGDSTLGGVDVSGNIDWGGGNVFEQTAQWRNNYPPTNGGPTFSFDRGVTTLGCVGDEVRIYNIGSYTQGANIATHLAVVMNTDGSVPDPDEDMIVAHLNIASLPSSFYIPWIQMDGQYFRVALVACAKTRTGYQYNNSFNSQSIADTTSRRLYPDTPGGILYVGHSAYETRLAGNNLNLYSNLECRGLNINNPGTVDGVDVGAHITETNTHGVGEIVGRTETQTLTNKTLNSPTLSGTAYGNHNMSGVKTLSSSGAKIDAYANDGKIKIRKQQITGATPAEPSMEGGEAMWLDLPDLSGGAKRYWCYNDGANQWYVEMVQKPW